MKNIIYCFSGTGNCMNAAIKIGKALKDTRIISMKCNPEDAASEDAEIIGFIFPVYHWSLPEPAKKFIREVQINTQAYIFGITVCGGIAFNTLNDFKRIIEAKNATVAYTEMVKSVSSYVAAYEPFPNPEKVLPKSECALMQICEDLRLRVHKNTKNRNYLLAAIRNLIQPHFVNELPTKDKDFIVSDECTGCGLCAKVCIANNITIENGKPTFTHHCAQCMGCIVFCPKSAINYKDKTQNRMKYHNPNVTAKEMSEKCLDMSNK